MIFSKRVSPSNLYIEYLQLMNGVLKLTEKELEVMSEVMKINDIDKRLKSYLSPDERDALLLGPDSRKLIRKTLGISQYNLNNYINSLKKKGVLKEKYSNGPLIINPILSPVIDSNTAKIEFKLEISNE